MTDRDTGGARRILDQRLADGEITSEEHAARLAALGDGPDRPRGTSAGAARGVALVAAVLAVVFAGMAMSSVVDMGGHMRGTASGSADPEVAGAPTVRVVASDLAFDPTELTVAAGQPFNIEVANEGRVFHDLSIETVGFMLDVDAGTDATGSLTIDEPGSYTFICSVPGHAAAGMRGQLTVE